MQARDICSAFEHATAKAHCRVKEKEGIGIGKRGQGRLLKTGSKSVLTYRGKKGRQTWNIKLTKGIPAVMSLYPGITTRL